ncbi:hypothetical protein [Emcibacter nanhaiensis]|uniref:Uncharacterized protein n=1 Tax=Emcibacter nanhaiensis TaxID=1505037 RepID=A0A501PG30_9PROT|nr:hypothetical protein [Emcibacter nanhaiensis]TPD59088.1 hypothetical protein FIV46_12700 [Emcibacter nanhaiensis]
MTGLSDGSYQVRLLSANSPAVAEDVLTFEVRHHPLGQAMAFFGAGAVIFIILLVLLLRGSRNTDHISSVTSGRSHI